MIDKLGGLKSSVPLNKDTSVDKSSNANSNGTANASANSALNSETKTFSGLKADQFVLSGGAKALASSNTTAVDNSEKIAKLKEQIANGTYKVDPQAIAKGILGEMVSGLNK